MIWIFLGLIAFSVLFVLGVRQFATNAAQHKLIVVGTLEGTTTADVPRTLFARASRGFNRTRLGRWLEREFVLAGITYPPIVVFLVVLLVTATLPYLLARLLAPAFAVVGVAGGVPLLPGWPRRSRER